MGKPERGRTPEIPQSRNRDVFAEIKDIFPVSMVKAIMLNKFEDIHCRLIMVCNSIAEFIASS